MEKIDKDCEDQLEKFRLNFSRFSNRDVAPINRGERYRIGRREKWSKKVGRREKSGRKCREEGEK